MVLTEGLSTFGGGNRHWPVCEPWAYTVLTSQIWEFRLPMLGRLGGCGDCCGGWIGGVLLAWRVEPRTSIRWSL